MGSAWSSSSSSSFPAAADPVIEEIVKTHLYGSAGCVKKFAKACESEGVHRDVEACAKAAEAMRKCMQANAVLYQQLARSKPN